jgi:type IV pilus assembly protein PilM
MSKSVGLEIHTRGVRAVELKGRGSSAKVQRWFRRDLTPRGGAPDPEELAEALREIFRSQRFSKNFVIVSHEAGDTVVREIPVPFTSDDQIRKVIKFEAEHHLHNCDADDVIVQYLRTGASAEGTNLLVLAARKNALGRRIDAAREAGVEPLAMDLDAFAVFHAAKATGAMEGVSRCVLLNIAHRATDMVFVVDGEVKALRAVRMGVDSISSGLARDMDIDFAEADRKRVELSDEEEAGGDLLIPAEDLGLRAETEKSHAELERDLFHQKRDEFVARLKREFVRSAAALRGAGEPEKILVTGPGLRVSGLLSLLAERIGLDVVPLALQERFPAKLDGDERAAYDAEGAVPLGLALKGLGGDSLGIDFRQEELRVANKFELLKNPLAVAVTLLFVALMATAFFLVVKKRQLGTERFNPLVTLAFQTFSNVATKYNALGGEIVPDRDQVNPQAIESAGDRDKAIQRFGNQLRLMQSKLARYVGDARGLPTITSALEIWNDIFGVLGRNYEQLEYIDFEQIEITQDPQRGLRILIVAIVADVSRDEFITAELEKLKSFETPPSIRPRVRLVTNVTSCPCAARAAHIFMT